MDIDISNMGTRNVKTRTTKSKLKTRADESEFCTLTVDEVQDDERSIPKTHDYSMRLGHGRNDFMIKTSVEQQNDKSSVTERLDQSAILKSTYLKIITNGTIHQ